MAPGDPGWQPPHCPNPNCKYHNHSGGPWPCRKHGFFHRRLPPHRIQRYRCLACGVSFSSQTFSTTYWLKRPDVLPQLMHKAVGGMANRQIAADLGAAPTTIDRQLLRLGRHCLLFHRQQMQRAAPPRALAIDGFESFEQSQYHPFHFQLGIEPETSFIPYFTDSELRRKGRMTERQKKIRALKERLYGRPPRGAMLRDITELLEVSTRGATRVTVLSDEHKLYPVALRRLPCRVEHRRVSSRRRRDRRNLLWEVNRVDRLLRHAQAGHVRETLAWPKRRCCSALRLGVFVVWWNYLRRRYVRGSPESPGMLKGITDRLLTVKDVLRERLFPGRIQLPPRWAAYYRQSVETRSLARNARHELRYAF